MGCRPIDTPMNPNVKLLPRQGEPLSNPERYRRLVGKLNYLTMTRLDFSYPVSVVSQFMISPCDSHWEAVVRILRYIKSAPDKGYSLRIKVMSISLDIQTLIGQDHPLTDVRHPDIVF